MSAARGPLESARWWLEHGFSPIPIPHRQKKPLLKGWPSLRLRPDELERYFNGQPLNIGVILGDEQGSADVDLDCNEAVAIAPLFLPETNLVFGRPSRPSSHYFYRVDPPIPLRKFLDPLEPNEDEATIMELRCRKKDGTAGFQTVVPHSTHESGEPIRFEPGRDGYAATVDAEVLRGAVARIAAGCLLARYWPKPKAGRNDAFLAVAGILARAGWALDEAIDFNFGIYRVLWNTQADRAACVSEVRPTFEKHAARAATTGIPKLKTLIDERVVRAALDWLEIGTADAKLWDTSGEVVDKAVEVFNCAAPDDEDAPPPHKQATKKGPVNGRKAPAQPIVMNLAEVMAQKVKPPSMLVENLIPEFGATLISGPPKSNKTLLAVQMAVAVASGRAFMDFYNVLSPGAVMVVEQDDPAGGASIKDVLQKSTVPIDGIPFHLAVRIPFSFGPLFLEWLEREITTKTLKLVVLDSYTALRGSRGAGIDIVKVEQMDMTMLDELGKRTHCAILVIHHDSKGSKALEWTDQTAGSFAMTMATEALIHVCRFPDLDSTAPERLIQARGRHDEGVQTVVRFRKDSLDHEYVLSGGAAPLFPLLLQLRNAFGSEPFTPKDVTHQTGVSRMTAHRQITRLYNAGALKKNGTYGEYALTPW